MTRVRVDAVKLDRLLNGPEGDVARHTLIVAERVRIRAVRYAGQKSGKLRASIVKRPEMHNGKFRVRVGTPPGLYRTPDGKHDVPTLHHQGTRPHVIRPRRASVLAFYWTRAGRTVFLKKVNHPGTKPNPYLVKAALEEGLRVRFLSGGTLIR